MFAQGKEVDASGKKTAGNVQSICCWEVGLAEVGNNLNRRWQSLPGKKSVQKSVCVPQISSHFSLRRVRRHFPEEEKSAAISLIPPRGPAPQTAAMGIADQSNRRRRRRRGQFFWTMP